MKILFYSYFLDNGGVERMFYEWVRNFDPSIIQVDVMTEKVLSQETEKRLEGIGCRIITIPHTKFPSRKKRRHIEAILKENQYDAVHAHIMVSFHCDVLRAANKIGIPVRVAHSHNILTNAAKLSTRVMHWVYRPVLLRNATDYFACGKKAGKSLFGGKTKFKTVHNGIDLDKFTFDEAKRNQIRSDLRLNNDDLLIGSVGRLDRQKNYSFLLRVFQNIAIDHPSAHLLLVGEGTEADSLKRQTRDLGIERQVIFYGNSTDVPSLMSAMDVFVLPSLFEGLVLVLIEAQAIGLPCVASDRIPAEVNITESIQFLPLERATEEWADSIVRKAEAGINKDYKQMVREKGYDIMQSALDLQKWYIDRIQLRPTERF